MDYHPVTKKIVFESHPVSEMHDFIMFHIVTAPLSQAKERLCGPKLEHCITHKIKILNGSLIIWIEKVNSDLRTVTHKTRIIYQI